MKGMGASSRFNRLISSPLGSLSSPLGSLSSPLNRPVFDSEKGLPFESSKNSKKTLSKELAHMDLLYNQVFESSLSLKRQSMKDVPSTIGRPGSDFFVKERSFIRVDLGDNDDRQ